MNRPTFSVYPGSAAEIDQALQPKGMYRESLIELITEHKQIPNEHKQGKNTDRNTSGM
jgi:hypothetical protein